MRTPFTRGVRGDDASRTRLSGRASRSRRRSYYGSYDGAIIFTEPMVAKSYLETKPAVGTTPFKLPTQYSARGYQPTTYTVGYDAVAKEHRVAISGLVSR